MPTIQLGDEDIYLATGEVPIVKNALSKHRKKSWIARLWAALFHRKKRVYKYRVARKVYTPMPITEAYMLSPRNVAKGRTQKLIDPTTGTIDRIR